MNLRHKNIFTDLLFEAGNRTLVLFTMCSSYKFYYFLLPLPAHLPLSSEIHFNGSRTKGRPVGQCSAFLGQHVFDF